MGGQRGSQKLDGISINDSHSIPNQQTSKPGSGLTFGHDLGCGMRYWKKTKLPYRCMHAQQIIATITPPALGGGFCWRHRRGFTTCWRVRGYRAG
jgi:hypothetical protein